jgi:hypothetical protein
MCEEYVEIGYGAAVELQQTLRARYEPSEYPRTVMQVKTWLSYRFLNVFRWQGGG